MFYEVWPYYVVFDERPAGGKPIRKRVKAGFDVYLFAAGADKPLPLGLQDEGFHRAVEDLERTAREVVASAGNNCDVQIIPFTNSEVLDTRRDLRAEAWLRIRITHERGLNQPEGPSEENALAEIRKKLEQSGVREGQGGAGRRGRHLHG